MEVVRKSLGLLAGYGGILFLIFSCTEYYEYLLVLLFMLVVGNLVRGSEQSIFYSLFGIFKQSIYIAGDVDDEFLQVKKEFTKNFEIGMEQGAQCVVYYQGKKVVDLYGFADIFAYDQNTLQNVYSSTKNVTAIVIAMFVDRGLIKYEDKIIQHWPEFGKGSEEKKQITIEQVLRHEGGYEKVVPFINTQQAQRSQIKKNVVGQVFENSLPSWSEKSRRSYHAVTRGLILNEIIRRVDPQKRTVGEFLEDEIVAPLGLDLFIGVPSHKLIKIKDLCESYSKRKLWAIMQSFLPIGSRVAYGYSNLMKVWQWIKKVIVVDGGNLDYNSIQLRQAELPSSNGTANAKALGMLSNIMSMKGKVGNFQLFSEDTWEKAHSDVQLKLDSCSCKYTQFNKGGFGVFDKKTGYTRTDQGFVGWQGLGGSVMMWHPEYQIGFAYTMNLLDADISHQRGYRLKEAAYQCVQQILKNKKKEE